MPRGISPRKFNFDPFDRLATIGIVAGIAIDQITKTLARSIYMLQPPTRATTEDAAVELAYVGTPNTFACQLSVTHLSNGGVTLGALETSYPLVATFVFFATTIAGLAACAWLYNGRIAGNCTTIQRLVYRLCAASIAAGIVSNLLDRVRLGYVIDWIYVQFYFKNVHFSAPVFNLADTYIAAGIALALIGFVVRFYVMLTMRTRGRTTPAAPVARVSAWPNG